MKIILSVLFIIFLEFVKVIIQIILFSLIIDLGTPIFLLCLIIQLTPFKTRIKSKIETFLFKPIDIIFKLFNYVQ